MDPRRLRAISRGAVAVSVAAALAVTLAPGGWADPAAPVPDAAWHLLVFAALGASLALAYATSEAARRSPRRTLVMVLLAIWLVAASTELLQERIPGRQPELADWAASVSGGVLGFLLAGPALRALLRSRGG